MIDRLYIDNYKCLVNFDFHARPVQLFLGRNGSGKTCVREVLSALRNFVTTSLGTRYSFTEATRTRWQTQPLQTFELEIAGNGGRYVYQLQVEHTEDPWASRVRSETLGYNGNPLITFQEGDVQLFRDDLSKSPGKGASFRLESASSAVAAIAPGPDNRRMTWFKERMQRVLCLQINPWEMTTFSQERTIAPDDDLSDFASWYRHLRDARPREAVTDLFQSLQEVLDNFDALRFEQSGLSTLALKVLFSRAGGSEARQPPMVLNLHELSEGQRCLIALYTLLHAATEPDSTLCIDEPDNFVALSEIEPWLRLIRDRCDDMGAHLFVISHHPEVLNQLAADDGVVFERMPAGPTRIHPFEAPEGSVLPPAELVARGWDGE